MNNKELNLKEIIRYAKHKTIIIVLCLALAVGGIVLGSIFLFLENFNITNTKIGLPAMLVYIISMVVVIVVISHYEKVRYRLIEKVDTKSFDFFFEYFIKIQKKDYVYYEIKDIFMYGLWRLKDRNLYLKYISETDSIDFDIDIIKNKINKKEFLASSMFRCLTFHKNNVIYRNQYIFLNQEKFIEIINAYADVYYNKQNHTSEYIQKCHEIENKYYSDKEYAIQNYQGLAKNIGSVERFVNFSNNARSVKILKKILAFIAIIGLFIQNINDDTNRIVTILFNCITIILLLVDVAQRSDEEILH